MTSSIVTHSELTAEPINSASQQHWALRGCLPPIRFCVSIIPLLLRRLGKLLKRSEARKHPNGQREKEIWRVPEGRNVSLESIPGVSYSLEEHLV